MDNRSIEYSFGHLQNIEKKPFFVTWALGSKSKKLKNLFYTGQLTVPGPGVPPSLISGQLVADELVKQIQP